MFQTLRGLKTANIVTASSSLSIKERLHIFCSKSHDSKNCYKACLLPLKGKLTKIKEKRCCLKCFEHIVKFCRQFVHCFSDIHKSGNGQKKSSNRTCTNETKICNFIKVAYFSLQQSSWVYQLFLKISIAHALFEDAKTDLKLHNKFIVKLNSLSQQKYTDSEFDFLVFI